MKVLFIGGTGIISTACATLAVEKGFDLTLLNRGKSFRPTPTGVRVLHADIHDAGAMQAALDGQHFDVVADFIAFTPQDMQKDLNLFAGKTAQFLFISSASAYQTPPSNLPIRESTPLENPFWEYSRNKIACEELLLSEYRKTKFPFTIVRPSHTYDQTSIPLEGNYSVIDRVLKNKPVWVHGDGTSLWTLTHSRDFAKGFVRLLGNSRALGEVFHITSDEWLPWNQIYQLLGRAFGVEPQLVHVPSEMIAAYDPVIGASLLGDKSHSAIFDNTKIKQLIPEFVCSTPFSRGVEEIAGWYMANPLRQKVDPGFDQLSDRILKTIQQVLIK